MKYEHIIEGTFLSRPNRFIAMVEAEGETAKAHVKNTGRCRELFVPGAKIFLQKHDNPNRKTKYSLIGVMKEDVMVNVDSQAPNHVVREWLEAGGIWENPEVIASERTFENSRFDFYMEKENKKAFIEVKGVTLEEDGIARFPDAPTQRGVKHIKELIKCIEEGYEAYIIFVIQMKGIQAFEPNDKRHQEFGDALREAAQAGVHVQAWDCKVEADGLWIDRPIPVIL